MNLDSRVDPTPRINLVSLLKRTIAKIMETAGIEESVPSARLVMTSLVNIAAQYSRALEDDPKHIEALFHGFLTADEEGQKEAVRIFGEAFAPKPETPSDI